MTTELQRDRKEFQRLCVDLVTELTGRPIGLYYNRNGKEEGECLGQTSDFIISQKSWDRFESFCQYMHRDPDRKQRCLRDHEKRAKHPDAAGHEMCWAGLHNCTVTSREGAPGKVVLMGGEFVAQNEREESLQRFEHFADSMRLSAEDRQALRQRLLDAPVWSENDVERFRERLRMIVEWYEAYESMLERFEQSVHNIAHEFLIHVTALNVECDLLEEDMVRASDVRRNLKQRVRELHHKIHRLDDVVATHLVSYQEDPRFEVGTIGPIIYSAVNVYESQAREKMVDLRVELEKVDTHTHELEVARAHLRRALHNLVQNAVKYSFHGFSRRGELHERYVRIWGRSCGETYEIGIENYGVGIEPDEYDLIFEPGYQGRLTRNEYRSGSGNGLYFVKKVVDLHGGTVHVSSTPVGSAYLTRFTIRLPFRQS